jgi:hypothetical protein
MKNKIWVVLLCIHCLGLAVAAQNPAKRQVVLQVSNGGFISFKSETSTDNKHAADSKSLASLIYSQALSSDNHIIHRVLTDADQRVIFGYDLSVVADPFTRKFSIGVLPADEAFRRTFLKESAQPSTETFATFPKSATQQTLDDGDAVSLELLVNQESGVKIVDLVRVTFDRSILHENSFETAPKDFTLDAVELSVKSYQLLIDGTLISRSKPTVGCSGSLLWLYVPQRGRFIFSLAPRDGYSFQKIGVLDDNRIEFVIDGERYEWLSAFPILPNGGTWNLWVLPDPNYVPLFSSFKPITKPPGVLDKIEQAFAGNKDQPTYKDKIGVMPYPKIKNSPKEKNQIVIPQRVMIGGADSMTNLLPKSP